MISVETSMSILVFSHYSYPFLLKREKPFLFIFWIYFSSFNCAFRDNNLLGPFEEHPVMVNLIEMRGHCLDEISKLYYRNYRAVPVKRGG